MASAVLASGNESSWAQSGGGFMGKLPYLNPNPNPKKKQKQFHPKTVNGGGRQNHDNSPAVTQAASDDAYSFNQIPTTEINRNEFNRGGYMTYSVASYTKSELSDLRKRLHSELEQIRNLRDRIESGQFSGCNNAHNPKSHGKSKKLSGNKRPLPVGSNKDQKRFSNAVDRTPTGNAGNSVDNEVLMKECNQILTKLMKHKVGWIFNTPVDAVNLGLHDYHQIVKRPMDLGTVKSNMSNKLYLSPAEFAADVRLTFNNALLYNPKTDQVHGYAEMLLARFEELYRPIEEKLGNRRGFSGGAGTGSGFGGLVEELQGSSWNQIPTPERAKRPKSSPIVKKQERKQAHSSASTPSNPPPQLIPARAQSPVPTPSPVRAPPVMPSQTVGRPAVMKQPKPRAKDPNKREMSIEEKHKLGIGLQSLPQEKMPQLVQIIRKRNEHLAQEGDEIELDIEALDTETLWELDRFVTNWKKMVSKTKRQALMVNNNAAAAPSGSNPEVDEAAVSERNDSVKKPKKGEAGDEDVDIDDDMPATSFPPVEIEKDEGGIGQDQGHASSSSSSSSGSSSDSSSSSDSDSGSSSGSDSDADDAQS